jgi:hypothetical protein
VAESGGGKSSKTRAAVKRNSPKKRSHRAGDIGRALRSVYDETLREDVPDDFLDLLGKLG